MAISINFQRSHRGVDDLLSHGATILENLRDQRMTIKGIKKKVLVNYMIIYGYY